MENIINHLELLSNKERCNFSTKANTTIAKLNAYAPTRNKISKLFFFIETLINLHKTSIEKYIYKDKPPALPTSMDMFEGFEEASDKTCLREK